MRLKGVLLPRVATGIRGNVMKRRLVGVGIVSFAVGLGATVVARAWVVRTTSSLIYYRLSTVPTRPVAVVLGARVFPNGALSSVLAARMDAGINLYRAGRVQKLIVSGDNSRSDYDEVTAMKRYAVAHGVPAPDVVRDFAGFRTLDSCYRALHVFGVHQAVFVTQAFHLPRTLFIARSMGIDAIGFASSPGLEKGAIARLEVREGFATLSAIADTTVLHRRAHFPGPPEPLFGNESGDR